MKDLICVRSGPHNSRLAITTAIIELTRALDKLNLAPGETADGDRVEAHLKDAKRAIDIAIVSNRQLTKSGRNCAPAERDQS